MKVYVLQRCFNYEGDPLYGVFTTLEKAKMWALNAAGVDATWLNHGDGSYYCEINPSEDWMITKVEVDSPDA